MLMTSRATTMETLLKKRWQVNMISTLNFIPLWQTLINSILAVCECPSIDGRAYHLQPKLVAVTPVQAAFQRHQQQLCDPSWKPEASSRITIPWRAFSQFTLSYIVDDADLIVDYLPELGFAEAPPETPIIDERVRHHHPVGPC
jgi:hypothetical protein